MSPSASSHRAKPAGAAFSPARRLCAPTKSLTHLLTDSLTYLLTYWMTDLTICAKASRARRNRRRVTALRANASHHARRESWRLRLGPGWGLARAAHWGRVRLAEGRPPTGGKVFGGRFFVMLAKEFLR